MGKLIIFEDFMSESWIYQNIIHLFIYLFI
jgi:hypothetical protein